MNEKELMEIAKRAVRTFGYEAQIKLMIEECAETIQVLVKMNRKFNGSDLYEMVGEFVDLELMLAQMKVMFPSPVWIDRRYEKIERLKKLLDDAEEISKR